MDSVDKVNKLSKSDFISVFGNVFEKTDWIAEKTYDLKPFNNFQELFSKMVKIFENSKKENHLEILNAHPDLLVEKQLTDDSRKEQNNANLNQCTEEEFKEFEKPINELLDVTGTDIFHYSTHCLENKCGENTDVKIFVTKKKQFC